MIIDPLWFMTGVILVEFIKLLCGDMRNATPVAVTTVVVVWLHLINLSKEK